MIKTVYHEWDRNYWGKKRSRAISKARHESEASRISILERHTGYVPKPGTGSRKGEFMPHTTKRRGKRQLENAREEFNYLKLQPAFGEWLARQPKICRYCRDPLTHWHIDHIIPLVLWGSNSLDNLCISCKTCNLRKGARLYRGDTP